MTSAWYVLQATPGREKQIKRDLEARIDSYNMSHAVHRVVVPVEAEIHIKDGHRTLSERKMFPGYVLVYMIEASDSEASIHAHAMVRGTPGIQGIVSSGDIPTPLSDAEVRTLMSRVEAAPPKVQPSIQKGQTVRIVDGPFAEMPGTVDEVNESTVKVLVEMFGQETRVELDFLKVERIA